MADRSRKVTVITVCRNACDNLVKTVESVERQTYTNIEYIVVDGASTDETLQWLQQYSGRSIRWISEPDRGLYDAMNKGIGMATGDWAIFMNAGDCFANDRVLELIFDKHKCESDIIYGDVIKNGCIKKAEPPHNSHRMYFCHQSVLVKVDLLRKYPFDITYRMSADFKQMKQLWAAGREFFQFDFPISIFDTSGVSNTNRSSGILDNIRVVRELDSFMEQVKLLPRLYFVWLICRIRGY